MRSQLSHRIFRQLTYGVVHIEPGLRCPPSLATSQRCLRCQRLSPSPRIGRGAKLHHHQQRSIFGFSFRPKRKQKDARYDPGYETLLELDQRLKTEVRTPPVEEVAHAFKTYVGYAARRGSGLEEIQAAHLNTAFLFLTRQRDAGLWDGELAIGDIMKTLRILGQRRSQGVKSHLELSRALFDYSLARLNGNENGEQPASPVMRECIEAHIQVLANQADALAGKATMEKYWDQHLQTHRDGSTTPVYWSALVEGLAREGHDKALEELIGSMRIRGIPCTPLMHEKIVKCFAIDRQDVAATKKWYAYSIADPESPSAEAAESVLNLCIAKEDFAWGDVILKELMSTRSDEKLTWDLALLWAAAKGRGVDEIERMMEVTIRRTHERLELHPNITTINTLVKFANSRNDPYTAERYIALGKKWGFEPDALTYFLQLEYRIKVKDLSGAMTALSSLRIYDLQDLDDVSCINDLIVAFCQHRSEEYETIMSLAEDLTERKAAFSPRTVAALTKLHLQRDEIDDLKDLLSTYVHSFGMPARELVRQALVDHIEDLETPIIRAWDSYKILYETFPEISATTRAQIMQAFWSRLSPPLAIEVFRDMRKSQLKDQRPTVDHYITCLEGVAKHGAVQYANTIRNIFKLDSQIEPTTALYNAFIKAYVACDESKVALEFWEDIADSAEGPNYRSIQIALRACEKAPWGARRAREIWGKLKSMDIEVTQEIYAAYLGSLAGHSEFDACVELCQKAEGEGLAVDALLYVHPFIDTLHLRLPLWLTTE